MEFLLWLLLGIVLSLVILEALKHLIARKTSQIFFFLVIIIFIIFSYTTIVEKNEFFKDKPYLQTGATIVKQASNKIKNSEFINSTLKSKDLLEKNIFKKD